jgi:hypothetical protein
MEALAASSPDAVSHRKQSPEWLMWFSVSVFSWTNCKGEVILSVELRTLASTRKP